MILFFITILDFPLCINAFLLIRSDSEWSLISQWKWFSKECSFQELWFFYSLKLHSLTDLDIIPIHHSLIPINGENIILDNNNNPQLVTKLWLCPRQWVFIFDFMLRILLMNIHWNLHFINSFDSTFFPHYR